MTFTVHLNEGLLLLIRSAKPINLNINHAISANLCQHKMRNIGKKNAINSVQSRAARALLGWSRQELATAASVAERTLIDFEREARRPYERTLAEIRRALQDAGIIFIDENGGGVGVRLKHPSEN